MKEQREFHYEKFVNYIVVVISCVMFFILSVGFMIEYIKGTRTLGFVLPLLSIGLLSLIVGMILFLKYPLSRYIRYITFNGFFIMYVFTLMTATTSVTFTFVFPLAALFCIYLDRLFMTIVTSFVLTLNGVYVIHKWTMVKKLELGDRAYNQFTTTILIHVFVLILFMSSLLAIIYVFNRLKATMDNKIQEANEARISEQKLFLQATTDGLTGVFNRRYFLDKVREQLDEASSVYALMLLDIDDFKHVNDTFGHLAGDQVLVEFSNILKKTFADVDLVGRVGGEEFAVFLKVNGEEESQEAAERLRVCVENSMISIDEIKQIRITISGGIAHSNRKGIRLEDLYHHADMALYTSKENGKNKISLADIGKS